MLSRLQVKNYVLIDSLEIEFPEGLVIITGQTGAGKSILLGALSLLMGAKADSSMVAEGADNCIVEAEFDVAPDDEELRAVLEDNAVEWEGGHLIVRRTVNRSGRSRSFLNDSPVPVTLLQSISARLVDIHSQHQTMMLSDRHFQLDILDRFAGNIPQRDLCAQLWSRLMKQKAELAAVEERIAALASEKDYNEARFRRLDEASLRVGELDELEAEQKQLANAEEIKSSLSVIEELFTNASSGDSMSLNASLKETEKLLNRLSAYVSEAAALSERVESCRRELDDILSEVTILNSRTELNQSRLEEVENRMSLLYGLMQKYSCHDENGLIALRDNLSESLFDSTQLEDRRTSLLGNIDETSAELDAVAGALHAAREKAAVAFAEDITASIQSLELPYAVFKVELVRTGMSSTGRDMVVFKFSSTGRNAVDVAQCASGGELSRIMLALKALKARYTNMPTMIFDEIDTGVSGSVADKMGSMICAMGDYMQVFAITHLPQVSAKGTAHYLVSKEIDPATSKAVSHIKRIDGQDRILEIARMLSGSTLTDAAVANAKSLLGL